MCKTVCVFLEYMNLALLSHSFSGLGWGGGGGGGGGGTSPLAPSSAGIGPFMRAIHEHVSRRGLLMCSLAQLHPHSEKHTQ